MERPTSAIVHLDRLASNVRVVQNMIGRHRSIIGVVKADAYGHGMIPVAKTLVKCGVERLGVAIVQEGVQLRKAGLGCPILIFGGLDPQHLQDIVAYDMEQTVYSCECVKLLENYAQEVNQRVKIHIKIDTGMNRVGIPWKQCETLYECLQRCSMLDSVGLYTHFACSDEPDDTFTQVQNQRFCHAMALYKRYFTALPLCHAGNSGAIATHPEAYHHAVRPGILLYGYPEHQHIGQPVLEWKTRVIQVKTIDEGETVSYGRIFKADQPTVIATLPVGYADGYRRSWGSKADVLIHGQRCPVVGRVCMDLCMADVSSLDEVRCGDEAVLIGNQGDQEITAYELACLDDTISYEVLTSISSRVPRIYVGEKEC